MQQPPLAAAGHEPHTRGGEYFAGEYFIVGNFVFQMYAKFPAQFSGHCAK